ncbi:MAG: cell division protein SepF [Candidatus Wukongarchaeota archaeon]|nr:cell division protein SepF [Candidatus Wukongarchaeota archaeon]
MVFGRLWNRKKRNNSNMLLPDLEFFDGEKDVIARIKAFPLERLSDIERIKNEILSGNTVILSIKAILYTNPINLKRLTQQIKALLNVHGGQIVQMGDQFILVTPPTIRFEKEKRTSELMEKKDIEEREEKGFGLQNRDLKIDHEGKEIINSFLVR